MEINCPPEIPAHEFAVNVLIDGLLSPDTKHVSPPETVIAPRFDYLKPLIWIGGGLLPWAGLAALLVSR